MLTSPDWWITMVVMTIVIKGGEYLVNRFWGERIDRYNMRWLRKFCRENKDRPNV